MFTKKIFACFAYFFVVCLLDLAVSFALLQESKGPKEKQKVEAQDILRGEATQAGQLLVIDKTEENSDEGMVKGDNPVIPSPAGIVKKKNIVVAKKKDLPTPEEVGGLLGKYSSQYGVSKTLLKKIAWCESKFNPQAVNGPFAGMYQFTTSTWVWQRKMMGLDPDPALRFDLEEAIKTAAFKISQGGVGAWPVCGR